MVLSPVTSTVDTKNLYVMVNEMYFARLNDIHCSQTQMTIHPILEILTIYLGMILSATSETTTLTME